MVATANHCSVGDAVAAARSGTRTRLRASHDWSLGRAQRMAVQLASDWGVSDDVSIRVEGAILQIHAACDPELGDRMHNALGTLIDCAREEARKKLASGEAPLMLVTSNAYDQVRVFDAWKLIDKTVSTPGGVVEAMRHTLLDHPDLAPDVVLICSPRATTGRRSSSSATTWTTPARYASSSRTKSEKDDRSPALEHNGSVSGTAPAVPLTPTSLQPSPCLERRCGERHRIPIPNRDRGGRNRYLTAAVRRSIVSCAGHSQGIPLPSPQAGVRRAEPHPLQGG